MICFLVESNSALQSQLTGKIATTESTGFTDYTEIINSKQYAKLLAYVSKDGEFLTGTTIFTKRRAFAELHTLQEFISKHDNLKVEAGSPPNEKNGVTCIIKKIDPERKSEDLRLFRGLVVIIVSYTLYKTS